MAVFSTVLSRLMLKCFKLFVKYRLINHHSFLVLMSFDVKKSNLLAEKNVPFEFFWEYLKFRLKSWQYLELLLYILQTIFRVVTKYFADHFCFLNSYFRFLRKTDSNKRVFVVWSSRREWFRAVAHYDGNRIFPCNLKLTK